MSTVYETSPIKRKRRSSAEMETFRESVSEVVGEITVSHPTTIRHLFYVLVGRGVVDKTEKAYKSLCANLSKWRRTGDIPFEAFVDGTRYHIRSDRFDNADDALYNCALSYRRNLWQDQPYYVEVWCEKDAISGILHRACESFGVPVFSCRGFASISSLMHCADLFKKQEDLGKKPIVFYFGDLDPSGMAIDSKARETLSEDFGVEVDFRRLSVNPTQVEELSLPTRPTKTSDTRAKNWKGGCVEVDALSSEQLVHLVCARHGRVVIGLKSRVS